MSRNKILDSLLQSLDDLSNQKSPDERVLKYTKMALDLLYEESGVDGRSGAGLVSGRGTSHTRGTTGHSTGDSNRTSHAGDSNRTSRTGDSNRTSHIGDSSRTSHTGDSNRISHAGDSSRTSHIGDSSRTSHTSHTNRTSQSILPNTLLITHLKHHATILKAKATHFDRQLNLDKKAVDELHGKYEEHNVRMDGNQAGVGDDGIGVWGVGSVGVGWVGGWSVGVFVAVYVLVRMF